MEECLKQSREQSMKESLKDPGVIHRGNFGRLHEEIQE